MFDIPASAEQEVSKFNSIYIAEKKHNSTRMTS